DLERQGAGTDHGILAFEAVADHLMRLGKPYHFDIVLAGHRLIAGADGKQLGMAAAGTALLEVLRLEQIAQAAAETGEGGLELSQRRELVVEHGLAPVEPRLGRRPLGFHQLRDQCVDIHPQSDCARHRRCSPIACSAAGTRCTGAFHLMQAPRHPQARSRSMKPSRNSSPSLSARARLSATSDGIWRMTSPVCGSTTFTTVMPVSSSTLNSRLRCWVWTKLLMSRTALRNPAVSF